MQPLTLASVGEYLSGRGLVSDPTSVTAELLASSASSVVLAVEAPAVRAVVKQMLPAGDPGSELPRAAAEAGGLRLATSLTPGRVAAVLDLDSQACAVTAERAPARWRAWDEVPLGDAHSGLAGELGAVLARWHLATEGQSALPEALGDRAPFERLCLDPWYRAAMERWPKLERPVGELVEELLDTRRCFVHGALRPENVVAHDGELWVVDFDLAHAGDPLFDLASMLAALLLRALRRPGALAVLRGCSDAFLDGYGREAEPGYLLGHAGVLLVAAADGACEAAGATLAERLLARAVGTRLVLDPPSSVAGAWALAAEAVR
jgi:5-methylthioribose kinase